MTHVTCRLTATNQDQLRNRSRVIEYGLPLPSYYFTCLFHMSYYAVRIVCGKRSRVRPSVCPVGQQQQRHADGFAAEVGRWLAAGINRWLLPPHDRRAA